MDDAVQRRARLVVPHALRSLLRAGCTGLRAPQRLPTRASSTLPSHREPRELPACFTVTHPSSLQELVAEGGFFFANRIVMLVAVEIRGTRRYVPMLCDTGAPKTCISTITLEKFGVEASTASHVNIKLGQSSVHAAVPDENTYARGLNILGSDVLQLLAPDLVPLLISSINGVRTPPSKSP